MHRSATRQRWALVVGRLAKKHGAARVSATKMDTIAGPP